MKSEDKTILVEWLQKKKKSEKIQSFIILYAWLINLSMSTSLDGKAKEIQKEQSLVIIQLS